MRMELGTGHGRETELCGSVTDVSRTPGAIRMAWVPPRTPNEHARTFGSADKPLNSGFKSSSR